MNEPKKSEIEAAAKRKWPRLVASKINHRKHTMELFFNDGPRVLRTTLHAETHRGMLKVIELVQLQISAAITGA